jgi:hypothetical protein
LFFGENFKERIMTTRRRRAKGKKTGKTARQKQQPTNQRMENHLQPIDPSVLQRAVENPTLAQPETILQLQRLYGNRTVSQLMTRLGSDQTNAPAGGSSPEVIQAKLRVNTPGDQHEQEANQVADQVMKMPDMQRERIQEKAHAPQQTGQIQRLVDFNFSAKVGVLAGLTKQHDIEFQTIMNAYKKYKKSKTTAEEYNRLKTLITIAQDWLFKYAEKYEGSRKYNDLKRLLAACKAELPQVEYMYKMETGGFEYLTATGSSAHRHDEKEQTFAKQHDLTKAELTAIKVYTAGDYDYINPTFAENERWLEAKIKKLAGPTISNIGGKQMQFPSQWQSKQWRGKVEKEGATSGQKKQIKQEAREHGEMTKQGLDKLPNWGGLVYRGMGLPDNQIKQEYQKGKTVTYSTFTSTTDEPKTAKNFAADNTTGGKVGIFFTIKVTKGKDITMFSEVKSESEILLPPGATFTVDNIRPPDNGNNFYQIKLTQTS